MKVIIEINTDNAALEEPTELSRLLRKAAEFIINGSDYGNLIDFNGNKVGTYKVVE